MNNPPDSRTLYENILACAVRHAERFMPASQAFEVAHDIAVEMLRHPPQQLSSTLIYLRVTSRLRDLRRNSDRRAALDRSYLDMRSGNVPSWAQPDSGIEAGELRERIDVAIACMSPAVREAFLLVRDDELSYKEAAARLGISVGTVHAQLSQANRLLRECVNRYRADGITHTTNSREQA